ncbi:MBL fold metallo-hydrolase [Pseudodesulfovibrio sp. JC047]|uniref:MBL fold metallo-hydrolase n=1 Tax=Pseudodesulfovibrio sp. JC047 TaxID=2683199 RepID=UPI0013D135DF|nr:MBL fold metallo-hydrolase [Pseudodesulfovibrio sp. JC047]NDV18846.1 MBL fold metallo-hydrolase [Pseudodesulfovibrio sp. JC047]
MRKVLAEVDAVTILTLQDNYIDVLAMDGNAVVKRPILVKNPTNTGATLSFSPLAEHGFSTYITVSVDGQSRSMVFDFGCSPHGAAFNADLLSVDLTQVEALALSHGHMDHFGGMEQIVEKIGRTDLDLVVHPEVFKKRRFVKTPTAYEIDFPPLARADVGALGVTVCETTTPRPMLDGTALFLGEIPRTCAFEQGMPNAYEERDGTVSKDMIEDDSSMVFHLRGKGLVVLSGCAHAGIVNTVAHAQAVTGVEQVHTIMGGFHLTGPAFVHAIEPTIAAFQKFSPQYVVPAHCTGRAATLAIEKAMPEEFIVNMVGTTLAFS